MPAALVPAEMVLRFCPPPVPPADAAEVEDVEADEVDGEDEQAARADAAAPAAIRPASGRRRRRRVLLCVIAIPCEQWVWRNGGSVDGEGNRWQPQPLR
jgi:hypothetical protein